MHCPSTRTVWVVAVDGMASVTEKEPVVAAVVAFKVCGSPPASVNLTSMVPAPLGQLPLAITGEPAVTELGLKLKRVEG